jgi:hypothetical protein
MEFLGHTGATNHTTPLENSHSQSRQAQIGRTGQAIVAGTDYDCINIGHGFAANRWYALRAYIPPMLWVARRAVGVDREAPSIAEARRIGGAVERVVAFDAKAAERAEAEGVVIAAMCRMVICYGSGPHDWRALQDAQLTERLHAQLMCASALPARSGVPAMNFTAVGHCSSPTASRGLH